AAAVSAGEDRLAAVDPRGLALTASGGGYGSAAAEVSVTVTDDDRPALVLSSPTLTVPEGGEARYEVRLATRPTDTVTVAVAGHAGTDLTLDRDSLTFAPSDWNTAQAVTVRAGHDDDASDDTATLALTASGGGYGSAAAEVAVTVEDDDGGIQPGLALSETALAMTEGAGRSYAVSLATQPTDTVTVEITGHAGTDLRLDRTSLTFGTSDWNAPQTVAVSAARDEDEDEDTATLVHTASGGGYDGLAARLPVTVRDGIRISLAAGEAVEGSFMEVRFTLSSPAPEDVEVSWLTHPGGGTAHAGPIDDPTDFRMESGRLQFAAGETEIVREVWIVEDGVEDPNEQFTVQVMEPQGAILANPVTSMPSLARPDVMIDLGREIAYTVVTILEAAPAPEPVEVTLEADPPTLEEGGRTLLRARLAEPLPKAVRIPLAWSAGTAEPDDLDGPSGLTVYAGHVTGTATLSASEDDDVDDETLSVSFGELPAWVAAGTPDPVEITILDNDGAEDGFAGLTVSVADATVREGEGNLRFRVTLNRPAPGPVTVRAGIDPNAGTARRGEDYVDTSQQVRFETGDRVRFVTVLVKDDLIDEGEETLYLDLGDAQPSEVKIARSRATGTILNDDPMPAAWLSRFGRTVAQQALEGVAARIDAPRAPGFEAALAGQELGSGHDDASSGMTPSERRAAEAERRAEQAMAEIARAIVADAAPDHGDGDGMDEPFATGAAEPQSVGDAEAALGTRFTLTTARDGAGGTTAFWGRAVRSGFDGAERGGGTEVTVDGTVTTAMLGADHARGRWLAGLALARSAAEGGYRGEGGGRPRLRRPSPTRPSGPRSGCRSGPRSDAARAR
ncbi:MAG: hypothetical protein OXI03_04805, partial [Chloroflexota bacterium]|nr:hypothetical protein [Chloroflexota bacterium]